MSELLVNMLRPGGIVLKRRLGIFVMYDSEGIVDDYVLYLLKGMSNQLERLIIVCNGFINQEGVKKLEYYTQDLIMRENKGFDVAAYKYVLTQYLEWKTFENYHELVLFNNTFFGPFYPFEQVFDIMEDSKLDFWGLTKHEGSLSVHPHVQTYFLTVSNKLFHSAEFIKFWHERNENLAKVQDVIIEFEIEFTRFFESLGYVWNCFVNAERYQCKDFQRGGVSYGQLPYSLMKECGMPVLKIKTFLYRSTRSVGEQLILVLEYLKEKTEYDISLIWKHIIRVYDISSLAKNVYFNYITDKNTKSQYHNRLAAVISYQDIVTFKWSEEYLLNIKDVVDIYIYTVDISVYIYIKKELINIFKKVTLINESIYADIMLTVDKEFLKSYDYVCFMGCNGYSNSDNITADSLNYVMWDNCLKNSEHVLQIADIFNHDEYLGLLTPIPAYTLREKTYETCWEGYEDVIKIIKLFKLKCKISKESEPIQSYFAFWCRSEILFPLHQLNKDEGFNHIHLEKESNDIWMKSMVYFAQHAGYYSGTVSNNFYASFSMKRTQLMLDDITNNENEKINSICNLILFSKQYKKLYIYGAGIVGKKACIILKEKEIFIKGFIVSDDKFEINTSRTDMNILKMSDVEDSHETGVIIALNKENWRQVSKDVGKRYQNVHFFV